MRKPIVASAGMKRSGSTWMYNAARLMLGDDVTAGWYADLDGRVQHPPLLVKVHELEFDFFDYVLYSYRDVRSVLASQWRMWGEPPTLADATRLIEEFHSYKLRANFMMRYESMLEDPETTVLALGYALTQKKVDVDSILEQLRKPHAPVTPGKVHNEVELYHENHITGSSQDDLDPELLEEITDVHYDWLWQHEYV